MTVQHIADQNPDGSNIGQNASTKVAFYGTTPVTQRASSIQSQTHATVASSASFAAGYASSYNSIVTTLNEVVATLTALGIWKGWSLITVALVLHAGCGGEYLPPWFSKTVDGEITEVRLDANADVLPKPDIVATIENMGDIGPFDAAYSCHTLEHLHWNDAMLALREFLRVLKPGGFVCIHVPDMEGVPPDDTVLYTTSMGLEITGMDMHYGFREYSWKNPWMMHKCGFMQSTLTKALQQAGFEHVAVERSSFDLLGVGYKPE